MSQVTDDLARYKSGDITLDELATEWAERDFGTADEGTKSVEDVWLDAEDADHSEEGTWGEVRSLRNRGLLTPEEYNTVSVAADEAAGASGREIVTDVADPDPGAAAPADAPPAEAKGVVPCKDCPPLNYTPVTSTSGATKTVTFTTSSSSSSSDGGYTTVDMDADITRTLLANRNEEVSRQMNVKAEGGLDKNRGGAEKLRRYWVHGEGAAKIQWEVPGSWTRCVALLSEHMGERAKGYCNLRHHDATGEWPGEKSLALFSPIPSTTGAVTGSPALDALGGAGSKGADEGEIVTVVADDASGVATLNVHGTGHRFQVRDADAKSDAAEVVYLKSFGDGAFRVLPRDAVSKMTTIFPVAVGELTTDPQQAGSERGSGADRGVGVEGKADTQRLDSGAVPAEPSVVPLAHALAQSPGAVAAVVLHGASTGSSHHDPTLERKAWDESLHPRNAEGESDGGKFKPKGSGAQDVGKEGVADRRELSDGDRSSIKDMIDEMTGGGNRQDLTAAQRAAVKKMIDRLVNPTNTASTDDPRKPFRDASDKNRTALRDMVDRMSSDGRFKDLPQHAREAILAAMRALGEKPAAAPKQKAKGLPFVDGSGLLQFKSDGLMNTGMPDGVMVALYAPADVAATHAIEDGTPPSDMHVTLAYLGKADDVPDPRGLHRAVADFAAARGPVDATISGVGRFGGDSTDGDPVYLSVDSPALPQLRSDLVAALEGAGYEVRKDHGFSPHMTLGYVPADAANPVDRVEPTSTQFGLLSVAYGPDVWDYPMGDPNASSNSDAA